MSAQTAVMHASTSSAACIRHIRQRRATMRPNLQRRKVRGLDVCHQIFVAMAQTNGGQPQAPNAKAPDSNSNGARQNGSTPANQDGQAIAPKLPGEAPPKAKPKSQPAKGFNNVNKFIVPEDKVPEFEDAWHQREEVMQQSAGFLGFSLERKDDSDFVATSRWASIPEWEAYSLSEIARRSHLPWGVYQYVPAKGEGFPEDFIPFKKMDNFVNAKY